MLEALPLPASAWTACNLKMVGRYRHPQIREQIIHFEGIEVPQRQIEVGNIGHENPTLVITSDTATAAKDLFGRHARQMIIENEVDADVCGFHPATRAGPAVLTPHPMDTALM